MADQIRYGAGGVPYVGPGGEAPAPAPAPDSRDARGNPRSSAAPGRRGRS